MNAFVARPVGFPQPVEGWSVGHRSNFWAQTWFDAPRLWGLSALGDQELAGLTMVVEQAVVFFAAFCVYFLRFLGGEERVVPASR